MSDRRIKTAVSMIELFRRSDALLNRSRMLNEFGAIQTKKLNLLNERSERLIKEPQEIFDDYDSRKSHVEIS